MALKAIRCKAEYLFNIKSDSGSKAEDLQAFHTITTMLAFVQSPGCQLTGTAPIGVGKQDHRVLRVLNALSALLVKSHKIVAVEAEPYNGSNLQVLASAVNPSNNNSESLLQPSGQTVWTRLYNFTTSANPCYGKINSHQGFLINSCFHSLETVMIIFLKVLWLRPWMRMCWCLKITLNIIGECSSEFPGLPLIPPIQV